MDLTVIGSIHAKPGFALLIKELVLRVPATSPRPLMLGFGSQLGIPTLLIRDKVNETPNVWRLDISKSLPTQPCSSINLPSVDHGAHVAERGERLKIVRLPQGHLFCTSVANHMRPR